MPKRTGSAGRSRAAHSTHGTDESTVTIADKTIVREICKSGVRSYFIDPSAPPVSQLEPVFDDLNEKLEEWQPFLTPDDKRAIREKIRRIVGKYLRT